MPICGAKSKDGTQCQNRVPEAGQRCHLHTRTDLSTIWKTILKVCGAIVTISETAQGVEWIYQHAWPYMEVLWNLHKYTPEKFWWDSLALPKKQGETAAEIHSKLEATLKQMRSKEGI